MGRPILAADKVRFVGDPVAIVVTEQSYEGEDAVELVDVDYDPLPAVIDLDDAASDQVLLYEEAGTNVTANFGDPSSLDEHLFDGCAVVTTRTILNQRVAPAPMETRPPRPPWDSSGRRPRGYRTQGRRAQSSLAPAAGCAGRAGGRHHPDVGGAFGAKFGPTPSTRWWPGWHASSAAPRAGPRPGTRT